jgi:twitching motility protein PilT
MNGSRSGIGVAIDGEIETLIETLVESGGSDLHLASANPAVFRIHGELCPVPKHPEILTAERIAAMIASLVEPDQFAALERDGELDCAFQFHDGNRLRINSYRQQGSLAAAIRLLPNRFFSLEQLGLPINLLHDICRLHAGLVLVTGATSSGKSTTIASIVNEINKARAVHIHTIEDPIEYRHNSNKSYVTQREVGRDTASFAEALRRSMRQDPDVIVVGEMRDLETMSSALTLSETGHLTFATLHTSDAAQTVSRIISSFPAAQQPQVRVQLASTLQVVVSQKLVPWKDGKGRSLAAEILVATPAIKAMIRDEKTHQIKTAMQTGVDKGMRTLNQSLVHLVRKGLISIDMAVQYSEEKENIKEDLGLAQPGRAED